MSLSTLLSDPNARSIIDANFEMPEFELEHSIQAPPQTENYGLVGGAFTHLFRFWCDAVHPESYSQPLLTEQFLLGFAAGGSESEMVAACDRVNAAHRSFVNQPILDTDVCRAVLDLSRLSVIQYDSGKRARRARSELGTYDQEDIQDLQRLYSNIPTGEFESRVPVFPHATFGDWGGVVDRVHADLIAGNSLFDFRVSKYLAVERDHWRRLVTYVALADLAASESGWGELNMPYSFPVIDDVGVYFPRYGCTWSVSAADIRGVDVFEKFQSFLLAE